LEFVSPFDLFTCKKQIYHEAVENCAFVYLYRNGRSGFFLVTGLETLQILGVEMSTGGSNEYIIIINNAVSLF
jgi:hypothetical protein